MNKIALLVIAGVGATMRTDDAEVNQSLGNLLLAGSLVALAANASGSRVDA